MYSQQIKGIKFIKSQCTIIDYKLPRARRKWDKGKIVVFVLVVG